MGKRYLNPYNSMCWVFGKLPSLLKTKTKTNYKQTKNLQVHEEVLVLTHYCFAFRLMYGFKGSLEAELQERPNVRKTKHEQGLKTSALSVYRPNTDCNLQETWWHTSEYTAYNSEWHADQSRRKTVNLSVFIHSQNIKISATFWK